MEPPTGADGTSGDGDAVESAESTDGAGRTPGRRIVLVIYVASIATAAVFGTVLGFMLQVQDGPTTGSFGPVTFPITPLTLAVFGSVVVGLVLTLGLVLVHVASDYEA